MTAAPTYVHATVAVIGEAGVLVRGRSGIGKTALALALVGNAPDGATAALVGDDRIGLTAAGRCLVARPHPLIAGMVEIRGVGIVPVAHAPACVVRLVVDLVDASAGSGPRSPAGAPFATLLGLRVPRLDLLAREGTSRNAARTTTMLAVLGCIPFRNGSNMLAN